MKTIPAVVVGTLCLMCSASVGATGLTICNSGAQSGWKSQDDLKNQLTAKGWKVRRIKIDGGCY